MKPGTRKVLDRSFTGLGMISIALLTLSLVVLLTPIVIRGLGAYVFRATVEHRRVLFEQFGRGARAALMAEVTAFVQARNAIYDEVEAFENKHVVRGAKRWSLTRQQRAEQVALQANLDDLKKSLRVLLGPRRELTWHLKDLLPPAEFERRVRAGEITVPEAADNRPVLPREQYGQTRWDRVRVKLHAVLYREVWEQPASADETPQMLQRVYRPRVDEFRGTALEPLFARLESEAEDLFQPRWTIYWGFLTDCSKDSHIFGGIWPEVLGTLYLTLGAILFAVPMGVISAIYLVEYAPDTWWIGVLRSCVSTLAGVPSIVFGLFGLAFFINAVHVSPSKSVLAGSLTLGVLILPVVIRASEEAIRAVPHTYKEAALSVGAGKWRTVLTVIVPAALPGILTGIVISMGRAAGETAPIMFTAAVSIGRPLHTWQTLREGTPALPWNIYNLCTEHEAVDEIRHVQYGMVLTLVLLVLLLNGAAIIMRARIARRLAG